MFQNKQEVIFLYVVENGKLRVEWLRTKEDRQAFLTAFMERHPLNPTSQENMVGETGTLNLELAVKRFESLQGQVCSVDPRKLFEPET